MRNEPSEDNNDASNELDSQKRRKNSTLTVKRSGGTSLAAGSVFQAL